MLMGIEFPAASAESGKLSYQKIFCHFCNFAEDFDNFLKNNTEKEFETNLATKPEFSFS
jgi:hypothetical protein